MTDPAPLPLAEAVPESLDELFSRDPLQLTDQDLDKIILSLRAQRARWMAAEAAGATRAPRGRVPPKAKVDASTVAGLEDLGL